MSRSRPRRLAPSGGESRASAEERTPTPERELARAGVAGAHGRFHVGDIRRQLRAVTAGDREALLGLEPIYGVTPVDVAQAAASVWGWPSADPLASVDPARTVEATVEVARRVRAVAEEGGRIALATGRPASLLTVYLRLATVAAEAGAEIASAGETPEFIDGGRARRRLRWVGGVAVVCEGDSLVASSAVEAGAHAMAELGPVDLLVGDHGFATAAWQRGQQFAAFVDFDAIALAVVVRGDRAVPLVPLDDQRPPEAYEVLIRLVSDTCHH